MGRLRSVWAFIRRHKYFIIISLIALIVGVLDENSYLNRYHHNERLVQLRREIDYYQRQYDYADSRLRELDNDPRAVERLAREQYHMKRADEDVFIFVPDEAEGQGTEVEESITELP